MLCFHCLLKISKPTLPGVLDCNCDSLETVNCLQDCRKTVEVHFDQAIKSAISSRQDQNIKEITSLQKKLILAFLIENTIHLRAFRQATANLLSFSWPSA